MTPGKLIFFLLLLLSAGTVRAGGADNVGSACATLEFMAKMLALNVLLPTDHDDVDSLREMESWLAELNRMACQPAILSAHTRHNSYYSNGKLASEDLYYRAWRFPNGQLFFAEPGADTVIYYPDGQVMAYHWMHGGQALFWPNGKVATHRYRGFDEPWYYPDGHNVITYHAGIAGALVLPVPTSRWAYRSGRNFQRLG